MIRHAEPTVPAKPGLAGTVCCMAGDRVGRQHKGDRHTQSVRFPREHFVVIQQAAQAAGLTVSDYVAREMALRHGLDLPAYLRPGEQESLPLAS